jgi:hypothetical protein
MTYFQRTLLHNTFAEMSQSSNGAMLSRSWRSEGRLGGISWYSVLLINNAVADDGDGILTGQGRLPLICPWSGSWSGTTCGTTKTRTAYVFDHDESAELAAVM